MIILKYIFILISDNIEQLLDNASMTNLKKHILDKIYDICFTNSAKLVDLISQIIIKNNDIGFAIDITDIEIAEAEKIRDLAIKKIKEINNIHKVTIVFTSKKINNGITNKPKHRIDNVKNLLMVISCKGGVGKSTISVMIAEKLSFLGYKVGIIDADIYGPSIPKMFASQSIPKISTDNKMIPLTVRDIKLNSIGFINNDLLAWRGPMVSKAVYQLLSLTEWGELDYLIIDTPPGTGDIHLSIIDNYKVDGAIIVSTPQIISAIDVEKSISLYLKFKIPLIGIIENMSYFTDMSGKNINLFNGNSGLVLADKYNIPLIDMVPLIPEISVNCDHGLSLLDSYSINLQEITKNQTKT